VFLPATEAQSMKLFYREGCKPHFPAGLCSSQSFLIPFFAGENNRKGKTYSKYHLFKPTHAQVAGDNTVQRPRFHEHQQR